MKGQAVNAIINNRIAAEEDEMNWNVIEGNWKQFRGKIKEQLGKLTGNPFYQIEGRRDQRSGKTQVHFGISNDEIEK